VTKINHFYNGFHNSEGGSLDTGRVFARRFRAHSAPAGLARQQWPPGRLHRTWKKTGEARENAVEGISGQFRRFRRGGPPSTG